MSFIPFLPLNEGSNDGWILIILFGKAATKVVGTHICRRLDAIAENLQRVADTMNAIVEKWDVRSDTEVQPK